MKKVASSTLLLAYWCMPATAVAQEPQVIVHVSVGGSVSSNPFLYVDGETAGAANLQVSPRILWEDEVGRTSIDGDLRVAQYTNSYGSDFSGRIGVSSERMLNENTTLRVASAFESLRSAVQGGFFATGLDPVNPGTNPIPDIPPIDTTIAGVRTRTQRGNASLGVSHTLDEVSSIDVGVALDGVFVSNDAGFDYRNLSGNVNYRRKINERLTLTAGVQGGVVDYLGSRTGDSTIVSPQLGIEQQLTSRLIFVAGAGISYVDTKLAGGGSDGRITFAGNVGLCDRTPEQTFCATASRSAQPTALGGVSSVTAVALNYDRVLSSVDRFSLAGRYGRTDENNNNGLPTQFRITEIVGATATYSRKLTDRVSLTVTPGFTKIYGGSQGRRDANFSLMVGLTMRFGKLG